VRAGSDEELGLVDLMRDPLIRLVMQSDGVTEQAMMALIDQVRDALTERTRNAGRMDCDAAARRWRGNVQSAVVIPFPAVRHDDIGGGVSCRRSPSHPATNEGD
jgi:hypothetical protein